MTITREMIEAGAIALAEWSAPNWGRENWGKYPENDNAKRRMAEVVLRAAMTPANGDSQ